MLFEVLLSGFFMVFCMILGSLNKNTSVIASEQSERGNLHTTENGRLNQELATPATQVRNDGLNSGCLKHLFKAVMTLKLSLRSLTKSNCGNPLNVLVRAD